MALKKLKQPQHRKNVSLVASGHIVCGPNLLISIQPDLCNKVQVIYFVVNKGYLFN